MASRTVPLFPLEHPTEPVDVIDHLVKASEEVADTPHTPAVVMVLNMAIHVAGFLADQGHLEGVIETIKTLKERHKDCTPGHCTEANAGPQERAQFARLTEGQLGC